MIIFLERSLKVEYITRRDFAASSSKICVILSLNMKRINCRAIVNFIEVVRFKCQKIIFQPNSFIALKYVQLGSNLKKVAG